MPTRNDDAWLAETRARAHALKELAERAIAQTGPDAFFAALDEEANSIGLLMKHVGGNLRSRWRDFLAADGEKPDRRRDEEFVRAPDDTQESVLALWNDGWAHLFNALDALGPDDVERTVLIRGEPHTVAQAAMRGLVHVATHVGQIVLLARHAAGPAWRTLSIPRGGSEAFTRAMLEKRRR